MIIRTPEPQPAPKPVPSQGARSKGASSQGASSQDTPSPTPLPTPKRQKEPAEYVAPPASRLVESPVFLLSSIRSGSTLLRVLLNTHSKIRAPHEMHLRTVHVKLSRPYTSTAMRGIDLDRVELEHVLWDRVMHLELERSEKEIFVDKTPGNTIVWKRLNRCWPKAKYLFLLRHPGAIVTSVAKRRKEPDTDAIHTEVTRYAERLEEVRHELDGLEVRYENLTAEPEKVTREICDYLGVAWEREMLDYGRQEHGMFQPHMGDWSSNIRSGKIQPAREARETDLFEGLPKRLVEIAELWGYPRS